eukprot:scaffold911_cov162-Ochromonas_danica.AAC.2
MTSAGCVGGDEYMIKMKDSLHSHSRQQGSKAGDLEAVRMAGDVSVFANRRNKYQSRSID